MVKSALKASAGMVNGASKAVTNAKRTVVGGHLLAVKAMVTVPSYISSNKVRSPQIRPSKIRPAVHAASKACPTQVRTAKLSFRERKLEKLPDDREYAARGGF